MRLKFPLLVVLVALVMPFIASAHQPVYVGTMTGITIPDPVISYAYYGELTGTPVVYTIELPTSANFYINILSPDIPGARTDFDVVMRDAEGKVVAELLHGTAWQQWHEEFAGDSYLKGPEVRKELPAGTYQITVDNEAHSGKYVLASGEAEVFSAGGMTENIRQIYLMKTKFFGKPPYTLFEGVIGNVLLGVVSMLILIIGGIGYFIVRRKQVR